jgi:hypothetical protein
MLDPQSFMRMSQTSLSLNGVQTAALENHGEI